MLLIAEKLKQSHSALEYAIFILNIYFCKWG